MTYLPNALTISRILAAPILFFLVWNYSESENFWHYMMSILCYAFVTDFFDGWLARKFNVSSHLGKMLDPIADKILVMVMFLAASKLGIFSGIGYACVLLIIIREFIISGMREYSGHYQVELPVTKLAKIKTVLQMVALFTLFLEYRYLMIEGIKLGEFLLVCATIISLLTGLQYFRKTMLALDKIKIR